MDQLGEHCNMVWKKGLTQTPITTMKRDLNQTRLDCFALVKTLVGVLSLLMQLHLKYNKATDQYHFFSSISQGLDALFTSTSGTRKCKHCSVILNCTSKDNIPDSTCLFYLIYWLHTVHRSRGYKIRSFT